MEIFIEWRIDSIVSINRILYLWFYNIISRINCIYVNRIMKEECFSIDVLIVITVCIIYIYICMLLFTANTVYNFLNFRYKIKFSFVSTIVKTVQKYAYEKNILWQ